MTALPEASIARELALCYTSIALVTDHDAGVDAEAAVTHAEVLAVFARNVERLKGVSSARSSSGCPARTRTASAAIRWTA